ncbi:hypothetical protein [Microbulbifer taiwanensis]|uniref:DUF2867 domain-containing protein n=1 Tax=Microbulbifer taiwanensis TaxID=986746 RepID=A0ABW1YJC7_9GAMM|nr:hypothetical protein [Microbulbifer taiwanensis]
MATGISQEQYVAAFYTTGIFKLERLILHWTLSRPSTDEEAERLAAGSIDEFAAWRVEGRADNQLLLCDIYGRTRSWLMSMPRRAEGAPGTRLYFGSAVLPKADSGTGAPGIGPVFNALLGFHKIYSRLLLGAAKGRLKARVA